MMGSARCTRWDRQAAAQLGMDRLMSAHLILDWHSRWLQACKVTFLKQAL